MTYRYDNDSRLLEIDYQLASATLGNLTYTYDQLGRRTQVGGTFARTGLPGAVTSAVYDAANEVTNWNGLALSYDQNGNMLSDGSNVFTWNARDQVAKLNNVSLQYDALGRRTQNAAGTSFLYDGSNAAQELSGNTVTANLLSGSIDEIFNRTDSTGSFTQLKDALSSTIGLADSSGSIQATYTYDPFGGTSISGSSSNHFQYTGRENEGNGLYYYRARYYSPVLHRFISPDQFGFAGSGPNLYSYAGNDPINRRDPSGHCAVGGLMSMIVYDATVVAQTATGRKVDYYAGWNGFGHLMAGNAVAFGVGCGLGYLLTPAAASTPVLLDTNAVIAFDQVVDQGLIEAGETPVISETVLSELNSLVSSGALDAMPGIVDSLPVIADAADASTLSMLTQIMEQLSTSTQGLAGDAIIGNTAISNSIALITADANFAAAMVEAGFENLVRVFTFF